MFPEVAEYSATELTQAWSSSPWRSIFNAPEYRANEGGFEGTRWFISDEIAFPYRLDTVSVALGTKIRVRLPVLRIESGVLPGPHKWVDAPHFERLLRRLSIRHAAPMVQILQRPLGVQGRLQGLGTLFPSTPAHGRFRGSASLFTVLLTSANLNDVTPATVRELALKWPGVRRREYLVCERAEPPCEIRPICSSVDFAAFLDRVTPLIKDWETRHGVRSQLPFSWPSWSAIRDLGGDILSVEVGSPKDLWSVTVVHRLGHQHTYGVNLSSRDGRIHRANVFGLAWAAALAGSQGSPGLDLGIVDTSDAGRSRGLEHYKLSFGGELLPVRNWLKPIFLSQPRMKRATDEISSDPV